MKKQILLLFALFSCLSISIAQNKTKTSSPSKNVKTNNEIKKMDSLSYSLGVLLAQNIKPLGLEKLSSEDIAKGIDDVLNDKETAISVNDANSMVSNEIAMINEKKNGPVKEEGKKFLEENAKKPGVKTTASGLQYEIITSGTGATPKPTDEVTTNYRGTLINGKQFDSSYDRGEPAKFPVNQVIPGWTEALQLMKEGDKWRLYIPYNLAYGERGAGNDIPPFATLIFDIELIKVN